MFTTQVILALAVSLASVHAAPATPFYGPGGRLLYNQFHPESVQGTVQRGYAYPRSSYGTTYQPTLSKPAFYNAYDKTLTGYTYDGEDSDTVAVAVAEADAEADSKAKSEVAVDNLAGAKSENANENANMAKGGEAFGFGALESDNRNLLANENNIEVANANRNELGVEVANFNANENSAEQESAALAEVMNEDHAEFSNTDIQENETENLNLNDNYNDRLKGGKGGCGGRSGR
ncbi:hypothetical protein FN846DRAFT_896633 [Sphaerosporella brunnea]|uniref:Uncharacterized protein n=1 Tax=Sphaerosporella brunnea TaxID=1250544 RepID=A0A5J5EBW1_9PEZI|nr:hypothetical protein FN846DRAFT_896633 [Sphaerosporella brunnea]